jgi:serralysin
MSQLGDNDQHVDAAAAIDPSPVGGLPGSDTIPGDVTTPFSLAIGGVAHGYVNFIGDQDWYSVNLVAGQTYTIALTGIGTAGVADPLLSLHGSDGTVVASNDNGLQNNNSIITFTASASGTYYINASGYNTGQYGVSIAAGTKATVDVEMGAGIIDAYGGNFEYSWSATPGTGATVTVGFAATSDGSEIGFSQFTAQQMAAVQAILQYYSEVCGLTFDIVNPGGYTDDATILLSNFNDPAAPEGAHAFYPGSTDPSAFAGNVYVNADNTSTTSVGLGTHAFYLLMHELGHSMGLSHPGLYDILQGPATYAADAQFIQDTHQYSVMSYFDESFTTTSWGFYPETLMLLDIYALQQIYGANYSTRAGDTIYGFNSNAGGVYNFATNSAPAVCIWDGGGIDTLNLSGYGTSQTISLIAGTFSNVGGLVGNLSIALGAVIENAVGGTGGDTIILSSDNVDNLVNGNSGSDHVYVSYNQGSGYTIQVGSTASNLVILGAAGADTLLNCEVIHFADGTSLSTAQFVANPPPVSVPYDFNNDDNSDVLWFNVNGTVATWLLDGPQLLQSATVNTAGAGWQIVGTGDFNNNGTGDVLWHNANGTVAVWLMNGTQIAQSATVQVAGAGWQIVGTGDFNDSGTSDILWYNTNGTVAMWLMNGTQIAQSATISTAGAGWQIAGTGDFNNSGASDILWYNTNGTVAMWLMDGTQIAQSATVTTAGAGWQIAGTGDFNGDGRSDILWFNTNGTVAMWLMNGTQIIQSATVTTVGAGWQIAGTGDYNGDGNSDVLWQNTNGTVALWEMDGTQLLASQSIGTVSPGWQIM